MVEVDEEALAVTLRDLLSMLLVRSLPGDMDDPRVTRAQTMLAFLEGRLRFGGDDDGDEPDT